MHRYKSDRGLAASTTWGWRSTGRRGTNSRRATAYSAALTTTTGTGRCSTRATSVCRINLQSRLFWDREYSILVNGKDAKRFYRRVRLTKSFSLPYSGLHHKTTNCNAVNITKIQERLEKVSVSMFPASLTFDPNRSMKSVDPKPNGGWADPRDIALCMSMNLN